VLLVEECEAVERLTHALVRSLRRLCGLPGNFELQPDEILLNLTGDVPWRQSIDTDPGRVASEIRALTDRLDRNDAPLPSLAEEIRTLATQLIQLSSILDANQEATEPTQLGAGLAARDAGRALDSAATAIEGGESDASALRSGLRAAARAVTPNP
jgi:hypothetical protein